MCFTGRGRSSGGKCWTTVPNPIIRGLCSFGRSRISKLIGLLWLWGTKVVRVRKRSNEQRQRCGSHPCSSQKKNKSRFRRASDSTAYGSLNSIGTSASFTSCGRELAKLLSTKDNSLEPRISPSGTVGPFGISLLKIAGPCGRVGATICTGSAGFFTAAFLLVFAGCRCFFADLDTAAGAFAAAGVFFRLVAAGVVRCRLGAGLDKAIFSLVLITGSIGGGGGGGGGGGCFSVPFSELLAMKPGGSFSVTFSDSGPISCEFFLPAALLFFAAAVFLFAAEDATAAFVACFRANSFLFTSSTSERSSPPEESELELSLEIPELLLDTYAFFAAARAGAGGLLRGFAARTGAFFFVVAVFFFLAVFFFPYVASKSESSSASDSAI